MIFMNELNLSLSEILAALESGNIGVWVWDAETNRALWSDHAYRMLGYTPHEFEINYQKWLELLHPDDIEPAQSSMFQQLEVKKSFFIKFRLRCKDGSYKWIRGSGRVIKETDDGKIKILSGTHSDITEKKNAEALLEEKLNILQEAEKIAALGSWDLDIKNNKLFWSDEIFRIFEIDKELFGASYDAFLALIHPDDREKVNTAYWNSVQNKTSYQVEHRLLMPDGRIKYVIERGKTFYDKNGDPIRSIGTVQDITEKVILERSIKEQEKIFKTIFDIAPVGIVFGDLSAAIQLANKYFCDLLGYSLEELRNLTVSQFTFEPDFQKEKELFNELIKRNIDGYRMEKRYVRKNGELIWVDLSVSAITDDRNNIKNLLAIVININDKKLEEEELIKAKEIADKANSAKTTFLANMSHEIRTPLNGIIGIAQLLQSENLPKHIKEYVSHLNMASQHLLDLINDILDFTKIESGELNLSNEEFSTKDTINEVIKVLYYKAKEKNLELTIFLDPLIPNKLIGDTFRLKQILTNLIGNSIKFTESGYVSIDVFLREITDSHTTITFKITDTGIGISEESKQKLFTPFFQGDQSVTRKYGGTGLGLSIVKKIVDAMKGEISLESYPNLGTTFYVTLKFEKASDSIIEFSEKLLNLNILFVESSSVSSDNIFKILKSLKFNVFKYEHEIPDTVDLIVVDYSHKNESIVKELISLYGANKIIVITNLNEYDIKKMFSKELIVIEKPILPSDIYNAVTKIVFGSKDFSKDRVIVCDDTNLPISKALIVEDNPINQIVLKNMLKQVKILSDIANDGIEAIEMVKKKQYDIIFMDIQMPHMDGYEATGHIRKLPNYQQIPIIAVSAHAFKSDANKSIEAGMNDHITKPVSMNDLIKTISKWIKIHCTLEKSPKIDTAPSIPFLDVSDLQIRGSDLDTVKPLVNIFIEEVNKDIPLIKKYIEENNIDDLQRIMHKHKGAAGNISLVEIHKNLVQIDKHLKEKTPPSKIKNLFNLFFEQMDILNSYKNSVEGSRKEISNFEKVSMEDIQELMELLSKNNLKAIDKFEKMRYGITLIDQELMKNLEQEITNLNFSNAYSILEKIKNRIS